MPRDLQAGVHPKAVGNGIVCNAIVYVQDPVPHGKRVWILHPQGGLKPVAEGIVVGYDSSEWTAGNSSAVDILKELSVEGVQMVQVLRVLKKNVPVMYLAGNSPIKFLEEAVCSNTRPSFAIKWNTRHLVEIDNNSKPKLYYASTTNVNICKFVGGS